MIQNAAKVIEGVGGEGGGAAKFTTSTQLSINEQSRPVMMLKRATLVFLLLVRFMILKRHTAS